eukprot:953153-Amphidinium_carterae.1
MFLFCWMICVLFPGERLGRPNLFGVGASILVLGKRLGAMWCADFFPRLAGGEVEMQCLVRRVGIPLQFGSCHCARLCAWTVAAHLYSTLQMQSGMKMFSCTSHTKRL